MINIDDLRRLVFFVANKAGRGTHPTPQEFNDAVNAALREKTMKTISNVRDYQPGRPIAPVTQEISQKVIDDLRHLKEQRQINVALNNTFPIPDGVSVDVNAQVMPEYLAFASLASFKSTMTAGVVNTVEKVVKIVTENEKYVRLDSSIKPPTLDYPIGIIYADHIELHPDGIQYVNLTYLRFPNTADWAYTLVNNRPVYDPSNSVDVDGPKIWFNEITMMTLSYLGMNIREPQLVQYAEALKAQGV